MSPAKRKGTTVTLTDPRAIRALAHPARLQVIDRLYAGEVATSTELAEGAGLSASAMSYHLRALEKWGIVKRAEHGGDARQRPWQASGSNLSVISNTPAGTTAARGALLNTVLAADQRAAAVFVAHQGEEPEQWRDGLHFNSSQLSVTAEELTELSTQLEAMVDAFAANRRTRPPAGARRVRLTILTVPAPE